MSKDDIEKRVITRRDFIKASTGVALGVTAGLPVVARSEKKEEKKTRVVVIRNSKAVDDEGNANGEVMQEMLDEAVTVLLEKEEPAQAWKQLFKPQDIVGIKSNVWGYLPTPDALEKGIQQRLMDAGIDKKNISVDDRGVLSNPVFKKATALVNIRPIRSHYWAGIGGCIKNFITFSTNMPFYHPDSCADLALVWELPACKGKARLNMLCAFTPQFYGKGPHHFDWRYVWPYKGLIVGIDPVAVDAVGLALLNAKRRDHFKEEKTWETLPKHVKVADEKHGLGTSDLDKIELIKLGWTEGMLI